MRARIQPLTKTEAAQAPDPTAPFGRDADGSPKAPFGWTVDGHIKLNRGRPGRGEEEDRRAKFEFDGTNIQEVFMEVFEQLGGVEGLVKWAKKDPKAFYTMFKSFTPSKPIGRPPHKGIGSTKQSDVSNPFAPQSQSDHETA